MKKISPLLLLLSIIVLFSCSAKKENKPSGKLNGLHKYYFSEGGLYLEINYKDSLPDGLSKRYAKDGTLLEQTEYKKGVMHGLSRTYHENGQLSKETNYDSGRINGVQKKYRRDGTIAFEAPYLLDNPCIGLKEFYTSGNPVKNYPTIIIKPVDELFMYSRYTLEISLSDKSHQVQFYKGKLTDGKYIGEGATPLNTIKGGALINYVLFPGEFLMEKVNIIAKIKTDLRNYYIVQREYNLAVENR